MNPLPDMPILGSSYLAAKKDVMSEIKIQFPYLVDNIVGKGEIAHYFSFSHNVFKSFLLLMCQNEYLWSKGLLNKFCDSCEESFQKTLLEKEIA